MPTLKEYQQIALAFREILEVYSKGATSNVVFSDFPRGACGGVTDLLGYYLEKVFDLDVEYVCGSLPNGDSHAWNLVDGITLDITAGHV